MRIPADWTFENSDVASSFDEHVREQLPWYDLATGAVAHFARFYVPRGGLVYDVGASTGNIGRAIESTLRARGATLTSIESSVEMAKTWRGPGELVVRDVGDFQFDHFDFAVAFLVLSFLPLPARELVVASLATRLRKGGAVVVVDKVEQPGGHYGSALAALTLAGKVASGVRAEDVVAKSLSLAGAQRPLRSNWTDGADWREWWRIGEFAGWLLEG